MKRTFATLAVLLLFAAPLLGQTEAPRRESSGATATPAAKDAPSAAKDAATAKDSAPATIQLTLPTTPKPTATAAAVDEPIPADELSQLLFAAGIRPSTIAKFTDGAPLSETERKPLVGLFASVRQLKPEEWDTFSKRIDKLPAPADVAARGKLWEVSGTLKTIAPETLTDAELQVVYADSVALLPADAPRLPDNDPRRQFFRCEIEVPGWSAPLVVYSLKVPEALRRLARVDERSRVQGLFVKTVGKEPGTQPMLVTERLAWYKHTPLGDAGMDYALYDDVRPISTDLSQERECLFQLLATMKKIDFAKLLELTKTPPSEVPLFNDVKSMLGELTALDGQARRCVSVIPSDDLHRRFGIARYYEIDLFTAFAGDNPIIFNVLELPPGFPEGNKINQRVRIPGTLLTGFAYDRDLTPAERAKGDPKRMQKAPLLIGKSLEWFPTAAHAEPSINWWVNGGVLAIIVVMVFIAWRTIRGDGTARTVMEKAGAPPPGTSLNDLPLEYRKHPDFSNVETREPDKK